MNVIDGISGVGSAVLGSAQGLLRFIPEPKGRDLTFSSALSGIQNSVSSVVGGASGLPSDLTSLLNQQVQLQLQMETVSLMSNVEKARGDMEMAPIRNMRVD